MIDEEAKYSVYTLREPDSELIRYVGITKGTLKDRIRRHLNDKRVNHRTCWFKKLKNLNQVPIIEMINDNLSEEEALYEEKQYIKLFKSCGANLVNGNDGGVLGKNLKGIKKTKEHIAKVTATKRKNGSFIHSEERKKRMSEKMKGRKPKNFDSFIGNRKGAKLTQEQKDRLREVNLGKRRTTKIIQQFDLLGNYINEYPSIIQATRETKVSRSAIRKSLNNSVKPRKYEFRYKIN